MSQTLPAKRMIKPRTLVVAAIIVGAMLGLVLGAIVVMATRLGLHWTSSDRAGRLTALFVSLGAGVIASALRKSFRRHSAPSSKSPQPKQFSRDRA